MTLNFIETSKRSTVNTNLFIEIHNGPSKTLLFPTLRINGWEAKKKTYFTTGRADIRNLAAPIGINSICCSFVFTTTGL